MSGSVPDGVEQEARALGDPTGHRLFRHIAETQRPVGVAELTELVGLNHNAVRQHLAVLNDAASSSAGWNDATGPGAPARCTGSTPTSAAPGARPASTNCWPPC